MGRVHTGHIDLVAKIKSQSTSDLNPLIPVLVPATEMPILPEPIKAIEPSIIYVDRIVPQIVEVTKQVIEYIDRPVIQLVEKEVERIIEVEKPVIQYIEKIVEKPVEVIREIENLDKVKEIEQLYLKATKHKFWLTIALVLTLSIIIYKSL